MATVFKMFGNLRFCKESKILTKLDKAELKLY